MNVHSVLLEVPVVSQQQLPRSGPDGQPTESSHLVDLMLMAKTLAPSTKSFRALLVHTMASATRSTAGLAKIVELFTSEFREQRGAFDALVALLTHPSEKVRLSALSGVVRSVFFPKRIGVVGNRVAKDESVRVRRMYLLSAGLVLESRGSESGLALCISAFKSDAIFDFTDVVSHEYVALWYNKMLNGVTQLIPSKEQIAMILPGSPDVTQRALAKAVQAARHAAAHGGESEVRELLWTGAKRLSAVGVPLMIVGSKLAKPRWVHELNDKEKRALEWRDSTLKYFESERQFRQSGSHFESRRPLPPAPRDEVAVLLSNAGAKIRFGVKPPLAKKTSYARGCE